MFKKILLLLSIVAFSLPSYATQPPSKEQLAKYKKDGSLAKRAEQAKSLGTYKFNKNLVANFHKKHFKSSTNSKILSNNQANDPLTGYFPSTGTPKMLILLVEFQDYVHSEINNRESVESRIFGEGNADEYPYDSQNSFYKRSSYDQLDIQGNVLDWYQTDYERPLDEGNSWQVKQQVIKDAITHHDALGHDFSQYDNDGNGTIDYVAVIWTGPTGEWASLWWGTFSSFYDDSFVVDGKTINDISWQQISYNEDEGPFSPSTLIHETGHALGLADYYDYNDSIGPRGGVGGLDQMGGSHDHNAFSKYILGWLTPIVLNGEATDISLLPSSQSTDAILLKKDADETTKYDEFFIVQYRDKSLNDINLPGEGLIIWHVDATLNEWGWFENDNSYSDNKFIRLIQADGLEEIELNKSNADKEDFFTTGQEFSPNSIPQSKNNDDLHSGAVIQDINHLEEQISLSAEVYPSVINFSIADIEHHQIIRSEQQLSINIDPEADLKKLELFIDEQLVHTFDTSPYSVTLTNDLISAGQHQLKVVATSNSEYASSENVEIVYLDDQPRALLVAINKDQDELLLNMLADAGIATITIDFIPPLSTDDFSFVHLNYGATNGPWLDDGDGHIYSYGIARSATSEEINNIQAYIEQGGKLILEGENVLALTPDLQNFLGVNVTHERTSVNSVAGENIYEGISINVDQSASEELIYSDIIGTSTEGEFTNILTTAGQYYDQDAEQWLDIEGTCSLSKTTGSIEAKTVISSCLARRLDKYAKGVVYNNYLNFFDINERLALNNIPQISAGDDIEADERSIVTLTATATDEDSDDTLTISWLQQSGTAISIENSHTLTPIFTAPEVTETQVLVLELTVSDGQDTVTDIIDVTIHHVNRAPIVSAGNDQTVVEGNTVNLNATISDEDEDTLSYSWQQTSGDTVTLTNADTLMPSFVAPDVDTNTTFSFELTVTDGFNTVSSSVSITIQNKVVEKPKSESSSSGGSTNAFLLGCLLITLLSRKK